MMRQTIFILLLSIGFLAAKCQEPDIECFSSENVDSLLLINTQNCNEQIVNNLAIIDSLENRINLLEYALNPQYVDVIADTFNIEIKDDRLRIEVNKLGSNIWITLTDGTKRTHLDLYDFKRTITLADSLHTVGMWRPD